MTEILFFVIMLVLVSIGLLCSIKLDNRNPFWVRWIVLSPCLLALFTAYRMAIHQYVPYIEDVFFYATLSLNYALIYSRFTGKAWLDLRTPGWVKKQTPKP